ncbi:MAG: hypothetical protein KatS3mg068_0540 [Candidatus Sericytochromatia bacterium]|nr:MAG: hypothetical protein KatS3mg068_0540 [Candidatus Sericytochromatia bacterium]
MVIMKVSGIVLDPQNKTPIMVLRDLEDRRALLIWIGSPEANSIMLAMENIKLPRPSTHDLIVNILKTMKYDVKSIYITDMQDGTFFSKINLVNSQGKEFSIDSRPSDAVAIAIRTKANIYVSEQVMASSSIPIDQTRDEQEAQEFKKFIDSVKPSDFFKS